LSALSIKQPGEITPEILSLGTHVGNHAIMDLDLH
jgi:hypothetical protein